jgi:hypothetical protein
LYGFSFLSAPTSISTTLPELESPTYCSDDSIDLKTGLPISSRKHKIIKNEMMDDSDNESEGDGKSKRNNNEIMECSSNESEGSFVISDSEPEIVEIPVSTPKRTPNKRNNQITPPESKRKSKRR